jgi:uncharacterized protein YqhQ
VRIIVAIVAHGILDAHNFNTWVTRQVDQTPVEVTHAFEIYRLAAHIQQLGHIALLHNVGLLNASHRAFD